jgi:copper(I)-binding protein
MVLLAEVNLTYKGKNMFTRSLVTLLFTLVSTLVFASIVQAHEFKLGDIQIIHPFARATVPGQSSGSAYLKLENKGKTDDKLIEVQSPIAKSVELHEMQMSGDVMKMREVKGVEIKAEKTVNMQPGGGYHIMLIGLKKPLKPGDKFPLSLKFEKAGEIDVVVIVDAAASAATEHQH